MSKPEGIGEYIDWTKLGIDQSTQQKIKDFFEDITTLTITTVGLGGEEMVTNIKLQGDINSKTALSGDKLAEYHLKMTDASVNLIKAYAQIAISIFSIFLPWAGIKVDTEAWKSLEKAFSQISLGKQTQ
jgi:hypothetical protein